MKKFLEDNKETIIKWIVILVAVYLVYKNWWRISAMLKPSARDNSPEPLTATRKNTLEGFAGEMYSDIYETPIWGHNYEPYSSALSLYDNELIYLAKYYKSHLASGNKLHYDISKEWYTTSDVPQKLMVRLAELGQK